MKFVWCQDVLQGVYKYTPMAHHGFMVYHCLYHNLKSSRDTFLEATFRQPSLEVQIDSDINQLNAKTPEVGVGEGLQGAWKERQSFITHDGSMVLVC